MEHEALGATPEPVAPRVVVLRSFDQLKAAVALLGAGHPVFVVIRSSKEGRRRMLDLLSGWALGSGGSLDKVSPNTVLAQPPGSPVVALGRAGVVSAVEDAFSSDAPPALTPAEERRLSPLAAAGDPAARRRLVDAYAEFTALLAIRLRPESMTEDQAVAIGQEELERLVGTVRRAPLLRALLEALLGRLAP